MTDATLNKSKLPSLTGYRFLLAFAVLVGHVVFVSGIFPMGHAVLEGIDYSKVLAAGAVSSFFVLSGFILTWTRRADDTARRFWRRRVVKIFPNHVVTLVLMTALMLATTAATMLPVGEPTPGGTVANLFLVHSWVPDTGLISSGTGVTWSLVAEMFFYLSFPFIIAPLCAVAQKHLWPVLAVVMAAIVTVPGVVALAGPGDTVVPWMSLSVETWWLIYFFPPVRALEIVLGILLARAVLSHRWPIAHPFWPVMALLAVFVATPVLPDAYLWGAATCVPAAAVIATLARRDVEHGVSGWLATPVMMRLGEASYALYLVHIPVTFALLQLLGPARVYTTTTATLVVLAAMAASIVASLLLWRLVEVPMMRRFARPRRSTAAEPTIQPVGG